MAQKEDRAVLDRQAVEGPFERVPVDHAGGRIRGDQARWVAVGQVDQGLTVRVSVP